MYSVMFSEVFLLVWQALLPRGPKCVRQLALLTRSAKRLVLKALLIESQLRGLWLAKKILCVHWGLLTPDFLSLEIIYVICSKHLKLQITDMARIVIDIRTNWTLRGKSQQNYRRGLLKQHGIENINIEIMEYPILEKSIFTLLNGTVYICYFIYFYIYFIYLSVI